jgi:hypothetical protein
MISSIKKFFLFCSGATSDILTRDECKTDVGRYSMIGAFVFLTAAFASLSGGYALYTGFKSWALAVPVGLLWGTFIFTLDRFIVSTIRKKSGNASSFSQALVNKLGEIASALPRLILAVFIGITVAVPLELKYFEPEIAAKIADRNVQKAKSVHGEVAAGKPEITRLEKELADMNSKEEDLRRRRDLLRDQQFDETTGKEGQGFTGVAGYGPVAKQREEEAKRIEAELAAALTTNAQTRSKINADLDQLRAQRQGEIDAIVATNKAGDGFLERLRALADLASDNQSVRTASWFLMLLLMLIETAPVLIKLFAPRGPYDDCLEAIEHQIYINKQKEISNFNTDTMKDLEFYEAASDARRQLNEQLTRETMSYERMEELAAKGIREAEIEIARARVEHWKQKELHKLIKAQ